MVNNIYFQLPKASAKLQHKMLFHQMLHALWDKNLRNSQGNSRLTLSNLP